MASSTSTTTGTLKGKVLCDVVPMKDIAFTHMATSSEVIKLYICGEKNAKKIIKNEFLIIKNLTTSIHMGTARLSDQSEIFQTKQFPVCEEKIKEFYEPKVVSVPEALSSPKKSRLSVSGYISKINDTAITDGAKRKFINLSSGEGKEDKTQTIQVKLWGDQTNIDIPKIGSKVVIKSLIVGEFNKYTDVNSTAQTVIMESVEEEILVGKIEGIDWDRPDTKIMIDGMSYICQTQLLEKCFLYKSVDLIDERLSCVTKGTRIIKLEGLIHVNNALAEIEKKKKDGTLDLNEPNFLRSLLSENRLTIPQIVSITLDLFNGGTDSTAKNLAWNLYHLANNKDKQDRLYEEIKNVLGTETEIKAEHINKMSYLQASLKETFRLTFPTLCGTSRVLDHDIILSGYNIPKGTIILTNNRRAVLDEDVINQPFKYMPERWLRDKSGKRVNDIPTMALLPFGFGVRNCPGRRFAEMEIYLAVAKIVQNLEVTLAPGSKHPDVEYHTFATPSHALDLKFKHRH